MSGPRALVIGGSGQIGRFLVPQLLESGHDVLALSRVQRTSSRPHLEWLQGDVFSAMPALPELDLIFSLGPLNGFAEWLARTKLQGSPRLVAFGSMSASSKRDSTDPAERALSETLRRGEQALALAAGSAGLAWTLLRQPVHAEDLATVCRSVASRDVSIGRSFDVGGGERLSFASMLERVRGSLPTWVLPVPVPLAAVRLGLVLARRSMRWRGLGPGIVERLGKDLLANDGPARVDLDWSPRSFRPDPSTWLSPPLI